MSISGDMAAWTAQKIEDYISQIPEGARIIGEHAEKAMYGRMPPGTSAYMAPPDIRKNMDELGKQLEEPGLSDEDRQSIEAQLESPFVKLGVAFYNKYGPQYTLDRPKMSFTSASNPKPDIDPAPDITNTVKIS